MAAGFPAGTFNGSDTDRWPGTTLIGFSEISDTLVGGIGNDTLIAELNEDVSSEELQGDIGSDRYVIRADTDIDGSSPTNIKIVDKGGNADVLDLSDITNEITRLTITGTDDGAVTLNVFLEGRHPIKISWDNQLYKRAEEERAIETIRIDGVDLDISQLNSLAELQAEIDNYSDNNLSGSSSDYDGEVVGYPEIPDTLVGDVGDDRITAHVTGTASLADSVDGKEGNDTYQLLGSLIPGVVNLTIAGDGAGTDTLDLSQLTAPTDKEGFLPNITVVSAETSGQVILGVDYGMGAAHIVLTTQIYQDNAGGERAVDILRFDHSSLAEEQKTLDISGLDSRQELIDAIADWVKEWVGAGHPVVGFGEISDNVTGTASNDILVAELNEDVPSETLDGKQGSDTYRITVDVDGSVPTSVRITDFGERYDVDTLDLSYIRNPITSFDLEAAADGSITLTLGLGGANPLTISWADQLYQIDGERTIERISYNGNTQDISSANSLSDLNALLNDWVMRAFPQLYSFQYVETPTDGNDILTYRGLTIAAGDHSVIDGLDGIDRVVISDSSAYYRIASFPGATKIWASDGADYNNKFDELLLYNVEQLQFNDVLIPLQTPEAGYELAALETNGSNGNDILSWHATEDTMWGYGYYGKDKNLVFDYSSHFSIQITPNGPVTITGSASADYTYKFKQVTLYEVEEIQFIDKTVILDLTGNPTTAARLLGGLFGPSSILNPHYVGVVLDLLEGGMSTQALVQAGLNLQLGEDASNQEVARLLYENLYGREPTNIEQHAIAGWIDQGLYTQTSLAMAVVESDINWNNLELLGLSQNGLGYV
ncbi:hypothetical protein D5125_04290 [Magnetovirga frankeli]|uniref:hypothetical protein n=1 Tax=Magnetovirga frankeli TaxID=947516 RepID=UPI0012940222|nr:hypothetical protein D5125_04290 [gamma proteobacterium SS-5]